MSNPKKTPPAATVHDELDGFDIKVNELGQVKAGYDIDKINAFLNEKTEDRKLAHQSEEE